VKSTAPNSARSNRALAGFWASILCVTILGLGIFEWLTAHREIKRHIEADPVQNRTKTFHA
jgi:hypothetical protein